MSKLDAIDVALKSRDDVLSNLQQTLFSAQQKMKYYYDAHHCHLEFQVGDRVLLKLQCYRRLSLASRQYEKLLPRYYGPFTVLQKIGFMAYKLDLPPTSRLHPVFHVSCLKPFHEGVASSVQNLPTDFTTVSLPQPLAVLDSRTRLNTPKVLVHWQHTSPT